jgi:hypothetical protein
MPTESHEPWVVRRNDLLDNLPNVFCAIIGWQLFLQEGVYLACIGTVHLTLFKPSKLILRSKFGLHKVQDFFVSPL